MIVLIIIISISVGLLLGSIFILTVLNGNDKIAKKAKKLRSINIKLLGISGLFYRIHVILIQSLFFWLLTGRWQWAIGTSLVWNIINTLLYYNWHYWFARLFIIGKAKEGNDNEE